MKGVKSMSAGNGNFSRLHVEDLYVNNLTATKKLTLSDGTDLLDTVNKLNVAVSSLTKVVELTNSKLKVLEDKVNSFETE